MLVDEQKKLPTTCPYSFVFHDDDDDDDDDDNDDGENDNNEQKDDQKKRHRPPAHPAVQVLHHLLTCLILSPSSYLTAHYFGTSALPDSLPIRFSVTLP